MNKRIQEARDIALDILKPDQADIEHGLELHAASIVVESYGFSPGSAIDEDAFGAAVEAGASRAEQEDMWEDMSMTLHIADSERRAEYLEAWNASGVTCVLQNAGQEISLPAQCLKRAARFTYVTDMLKKWVTKAVTPDDILAAKEQEKRCLYLTTNAVPIPQRWVSVEEELSLIRIFFQFGIRMMHLTYNRRNMIGDGCAEPSDAGLSDFGRAVVKEMNRVGMIVDVAHSGQRTSLEAALASEAPMVASHSVAAALNDHVRGKRDEVIRAIADTGGYVGMCCIPGFLGRTGDIRAFLDHIDYMVKRFGADHVAIGTDVAYKPKRRPPAKELRPSGKKRKHWFSFWPQNEAHQDPKWQDPKMIGSLAWTNWPLFTVGMVQRGHSDEDIQKIIGGNVLRVTREVLRKAGVTPIHTNKG